MNSLEHAPVKAFEIDTHLSKVIGWAGAYEGQSIVAYPRSADEVSSILDYARSHGYTVGPIGSSNSLGDCVVNNKNILISTKFLTEVIEWNSSTGIVVVQSGVTIGQLLCQFIPLGWILRSIPGVLTATIGGGISHNVHGKDSLVHGNLGRHIIWIDLMLSGGNVVRCSRTENIDLFLATVGGFGLTGFILKAAIQLGKIPSPNLLCKDTISKSLDETVEGITHATGSDYAQVWMDATRKGSGSGRGVVMVSQFEKENTGAIASDLEQYLVPRERWFGIIPCKWVWRTFRELFYPPFISYSNAIYYYKRVLNSALRSTKSVPFHEYYFFHNIIGDFYSVYRPPGFLEIQALLPLNGGASGFHRLLEKTNQLGLVSVMSGMKKAIKDDFLLSFSDDAATISLAFPVRDYGVANLAQRIAPLYHLIAEMGGKVNLSKDQAMPKDAFRACYKEADRFWEIKQRYDPISLFANDMSRRLFGH